MPSNGRRKQIRAVDIDPPQLAHAVDGVRDGLKVLSEAGRGHEVVDPAMSGDDLGEAGLDRGGVRDIGVVGCYFGESKTNVRGKEEEGKGRCEGDQPFGVGVVFAESVDDGLGLAGCFFSCGRGTIVSVMACFGVKHWVMRTHC